MIKVLACKLGYQQELELEGPPSLTLPNTWWDPISSLSDLTRFFDDQRLALEALLNGGDFNNPWDHGYKFTMENEEYKFEGCYVVEYSEEGGGKIRCEHWHPKR